MSFEVLDKLTDGGVRQIRTADLYDVNVAL